MKQDWVPTSLVAKIVYAAGFTYDTEQQIIYSRQDALQRNFGYAYGYDVLAPCTISAKIDCEPFFITYGDNDWMIELWKGQYGIETGCELGIYIRPHNLTKNEQKIYPILDAVIGRRPYDKNPAHGRFFRCPTDEELKAFGAMSVVLYKKGAEPDSGKEMVFERSAQADWWLTGFKWGVFSEPEELTVDVNLEFTEGAMCDVFVEEWKRVYAEQKTKEIDVTGSAVSFTYDIPGTPQPWNNPGWLEFVTLIQKMNQKMVNIYNGMGFPSNDPNIMTCNQEDLMHLLDLMTTSKERQNLFNNLSEGLNIADNHYKSDVVGDLKKYQCTAEDVGMILKSDYNVDYIEAAELLHKYHYSEIHTAFVINNIYKVDKVKTVETVMSVYKSDEDSLKKVLDRLDFDHDNALKEIGKYYK